MSCVPGSDNQIPLILKTYGNRKILEGAEFINLFYSLRGNTDRSSFHCVDMDF